MQVQNYIEQAKSFLEEERRVEQEEFLSLYRDYNSKELEAMGFALRDIKVVKFKSAFLNKSIVMFKKLDESPFSKNLKIKINDNVTVSERSKSKELENLEIILQGVVYRLRSNSMQILIDDKVSKIKIDSFGTNLNILKSGDNVTFDRYIYKTQ